MILTGCAIVKASVCGIFAEPTFKSEMVSQALQLEKVEIIKKKDRWYHIRLEYDGYKGWIHEMYLNDSPNLSDSFNEDMFLDFPIIKTAFQMLGAPYLWGGRSCQGYDCSGLIQTTMNLLGFDFPRDTKDQVNSQLLYQVEIENVLEEDIIFFEENKIVNHIGVCISKNLNANEESDYRLHIIHSSGTVRVSEVVVNKSLYAYIDQGSNKKVKLHKIMRFKENV